MPYVAGFYRGTSPINNTHARRNTIGPLGIGLMWGPAEGVVLMSEVPLYRVYSKIRTHIAPRVVPCFQA